MLSQRDKAISLLKEKSIARAYEFRQQGITAATLSRALKDGDIIKISRGLYQLPDADIDSHSALAMVSKRASKGVICLMSALAYYEVTDQLPRKVWIAIGTSDWKPQIDYPKTYIVRFQAHYHQEAIKIYDIAGVKVPIYSLVKTLADAFRNPQLVDRSVAIESLKNSIYDKKASPSDIASAAQKYGGWNIMQPYLEAITHNG